MRFKNRMYAPGPVSVPEESRLELARSQVYHRSEQFTEKLNEARRLLQKLLNIEWPIILISASGTGGMQTAVHNLVAEGEEVLVVNSGKFGARWAKMLRKKGCTVTEIKTPPGEAVEPERVECKLSDNSSISVVFTTLVETSTLVRQPVEKIGSILENYSALHVVDAISVLGAEKFFPVRCGADVMIGASQKGLMTPPGVALLTLNSRAQSKARSLKNPDFYFDLSIALDRLEKDAQTAWTGPVGLVRSLVSSLHKIFDEGVESVFTRHERISRYCRLGVKELGLEIFSTSPSVIGTALELPESVAGEKLQQHILKSYNMYLPGGRRQLKERIIRLGHLGDVDYFDLLNMLSALELGLLKAGADVSAGAALEEVQSKFAADSSCHKGDNNDGTKS